MPVSANAWCQAHRRSLRRTGFAALALYTLYLLAANVFLNSALGSNVINRKPERYHAQWSWAMSLYPGHIYARDIVMGGHARKTVWTVRSPSAHGRIQLLPLLRKSLSFGTIRARDVRVDVRGSDRDLRPPPRVKAPWRLHFDAITTDTLREVRFGEFIADGGGEASFALDKELRGGPFELLPSSVRMPRARVRYRDEVLLEQAKLELEFALPRHLRTQAEGAAKVGIADARLRLDGQAPSLDFSQAADGAFKMRRGRDAGRVSADLAIERGALVPGGHLHWSTPVGVAAGGAVRRYRAQLDLDVLADAIGLRMRVPPQPGSEDRIDANLRASGRRVLETDLHALLRRLSGSIDLRWHFTTLRWLDPMLSDSGWLRLDGDADLIAALQLRDGVLQSGSRVDVPRAALQADVFDNVIAGDAHAQARVDGDTTTVNLVADRFDIAPRADRRAVYVRGEDLRVDLVSDGDLARFKDHLKARFRFADARIPDLRNYNRNLPGDSLRFLGGSGRIDGDLAIDAAGEVGSGMLRLRGERAALQLGVSRLTGDLRLDTRLRRVQKTGRHYALDGFAIGLDNVRVTGSEDAAPWWARFDLDRGTLDWQQPFRVGGDARLRMRDASVLLSLFAERSAFPKWIGRMIDEGEAQATGTLRVDQHAVVLDRLHASNARIDVDARLRIADGRPNGDLYARWGLLGLGVELRGGQRRLHLTNAKAWYDAQPPLPVR